MFSVTIRFEVTALMNDYFALPQAGIFTDQEKGLYRPYGDLVKPNGLYRLPPFN
jgi:hypothetical protein